MIRFLALQAYALWQGGFLFYALIVVPVGSEVLGETPQGFVTRRVTFWLNLVGALSLGLQFAFAFTHRTGRIHAALLITASAILAALFVLHTMLDAKLEPSSMTVDRRGFYPLHAAYLILSGIQWLVMLPAGGFLLHPVKQPTHSQERP